MNGKQSKKIREMAALFFQAQPEGVTKKPLSQIYKELKTIHKTKLNARN